MEVTIGGERLGAGKKMTTNIHGYKRSSHNLSTRFLSSIAPGVLVPFYCNVGLKGDTFDIDMAAAVRTLPTQGPLFGSFKLQADWFVCPMRLYQGILHNNPINLGLNMNKVFLPKITLKGRANRYEYPQTHKQQIANNCLLKYVGFSGFPTEMDNVPEESGRNSWQSTRKINALPILSYYDIFKNYYANKQEEKAYVITSEFEENGKVGKNYSMYDSVTGHGNFNTGHQVELNQDPNNPWWVGMKKGGNFKERAEFDEIYIKLESAGAAGNEATQYLTLQEAIDKGFLDTNYISRNANEDIIMLTGAFLPYAEKFSEGDVTDAIITIFSNKIGVEKKIHLQPFELTNIDLMRKELLSHNDLGEEYDLATPQSAGQIYPYFANTHYHENIHIDENFTSANEGSMNGLCVKTYQSDLFNNWLKTEFIEGEDSITELTRIDTSEGLTMDALNITQKIYDMLNRIVTAGGTYQDWEEVNYDEKAKRICETPMWVGGYSDEIIFDEVIQTSESGETPLGKLGGRGRSAGSKHGGHLKFKVEEASIIMGIISITPRVAYSQGNSWYLTNLNSIDDIHKPALDGIGFQDLMTEQMAYFDTVHDQYNDVLLEFSAGKVPAWLNYMTDVDKVYGDFAAGGAADFMVLGRNYEKGTEPDDFTYNKIKDLTTYIDPAKFNYAFAYAELDAQNFWVNVNSNIVARRKMSAKIIPNL